LKPAQVPHQPPNEVSGAAIRDDDIGVAGQQPVPGHRSIEAQAGVLQQGQGLRDEIVPAGVGAGSAEQAHTRVAHAQYALGEERPHPCELQEMPGLGVDRGPGVGKDESPGGRTHRAERRRAKHAANALEMPERRGRGRGGRSEGDRRGGLSRGYGLKSAHHRSVRLLAAGLGRILSGCDAAGRVHDPEGVPLGRTEELKLAADGFAGTEQHDLMAVLSRPQPALHRRPVYGPADDVHRDAHGGYFASPSPPSACPVFFFLRTFFGTTRAPL